MIAVVLMSGAKHILVWTCFSLFFIWNEYNSTYMESVNMMRALYNNTKNLLPVLLMLSVNNVVYSFLTWFDLIFC